MGESVQLVVFMLDEQRYGLRLSAVERVVRAVEVTPLPCAPQIVLGVINFAGRVVPVMNVRQRFGLTEKEVDLSHQFIIAQTAMRTVALLVDSVSTLVEASADDVVRATKILPEMDYVDGVAKLEDGMILIHDLDKFLSLEEARLLDEVMQAESEA
jgi:purine-binding chemotaxis protein CheW